MASVTVRASFTDGESSTVDEVECVAERDGEYPDLMADLRAEAVAGFRAAHREVRDVLVTDPEPTVISFEEPSE
jgi:hypothetical protein